MCLPCQEHIENKEEVIWPLAVDHEPAAGGCDGGRIN